MAFDRDSQAVDFVKPDGLYRPRLSVCEDDGLADQLRVGLIECAEDRQRTALRGGLAGLAPHCGVVDPRKRKPLSKVSSDGVASAQRSTLTFVIQNAPCHPSELVLYKRYGLVL
jgi:hypothetical protein